MPAKPRNQVHSAEVVALLPPIPLDPPVQPDLSTSSDPNLLERIQNEEWRTQPDDVLGPSADVPSMISLEERLLYVWLAEHWATGAGAIVDLGAFAGGSSASLAQGAARAGRTTPVLAYDRFHASDAVKERFLYPAGIEPFDGTETLPLVRRLLSLWGTQIDVRAGDINTVIWTDGPIELLVIDAAKTAQTADRIAETFFPHLIPGQSLVIHQDFLNWKLPWLPAQMEWMSECFEPILQCAAEAFVYRCIKVPQEADLERGRVRQRRDRELIDVLAKTGTRLRQWDVAQSLATQAKAVAANPNARRAKDFVKRP